MPIRRFINLNEVGLAPPSSNTAALPTFTAGSPSGSATTTPLMLLYLAAAAEVISKITCDVCAWWWRWNVVVLLQFSQTFSGSSLCAYGTLF